MARGENKNIRSTASLSQACSAEHVAKRRAQVLAREEATAAPECPSRIKLRLTGDPRPAGGSDLNGAPVLVRSNVIQATPGTAKQQSPVRRASTAGRAVGGTSREMHDSFR